VKREAYLERDTKYEIMLTKDTAICIRALDYSETSQIATFFARETGKISAIAKGSKRPKSSFNGPIEVFSYGKIVVSVPAGEKLATLTEFDQQSNFSALAGNLFVLHCASFAAELVNLLTNEYDPSPELFDAFLQFLQNINESQLTSHERRVTRGERRDTLALLILFQLALLKEIGLQPVLKACANCKTRYEACPEHSRRIQNTRYEFYFSSFANGLICRDCEANFPDRIGLSNSAADCLGNLKLLANANERTLGEIEKVLVHHFTEILHRPPKMAKHILQS